MYFIKKYQRSAFGKDSNQASKCMHAITAAPLICIEIQQHHTYKADYDNNGSKVGALGDTRHDEPPVEAKENSFSLRDDCMDAGGRAKHGAIAEKARMRGYKIRQLSYFIPLSPALSRRERE